MITSKISRTKSWEPRLLKDRLTHISWPWWHRASWIHKKEDKLIWRRCNIWWQRQCLSSVRRTKDRKRRTLRRTGLGETPICDVGSCRYYCVINLSFFSLWRNLFLKDCLFFSSTSLSHPSKFILRGLLDCW